MKNLKDEIEGILEAIIGDMDYVSEYCDGTESREQAEENRGKLLAFITSIIEQEKRNTIMECMALVNTHTEHNGSYCDTGEDMSWACRSKCVDMAIARLEQYLAERKG